MAEKKYDRKKHMAEKNISPEKTYGRKNIWPKKHMTEKKYRKHIIGINKWSKKTIFGTVHFLT